MIMGGRSFQIGAREDRGVVPSEVRQWLDDLRADHVRENSPPEARMTRRIATTDRPGRAELVASTASGAASSRRETLAPVDGLTTRRPTELGEMR